MHLENTFDIAIGLAGAGLHFNIKIEACAGLVGYGLEFHCRPPLNRFDIGGGGKLAEDLADIDFHCVRNKSILKENHTQGLMGGQFLDQFFGNAFIETGDQVIRLNIDEKDASAPVSRGASAPPGRNPADTPGLG